MYLIFKYLHSGVRYIVLILVLLAIFQSLFGLIGKNNYTETNRKINLFALISAHTQLLIGIVLYFLSPLVSFTSGAMKNPTIRYWTVEHISMMVIAIILITIGYVRSKKVVLPEKKHLNIFIFYLLAIIIVIVTLVMRQKGV